jgi:CO/xanthine dehydrogenase FAD-binding subunit
MSYDFNVESPKTADELLQVIDANQGKQFRFGAGGTDLLLELKRNEHENLTVVNLAKMQDPLFRSVVMTDDGYRIGALVTAAELLANEELKTQFYTLWEATYNLASMQIRQVATIGGNICTASPSGDIACALIALHATCEIINTNGEVRYVPIREFSTGVRKTVLQNNEVLRSVMVPFNFNNNVHSGFIKVGTRLSMECSVVSLAYHIQRDDSRSITHAGIAIGAVAPTIMYTDSACAFLIGKKDLNESECEEFANLVSQYASPISDVRASAWYREEVLFNVSKGLMEVGHTDK